MRSTSKITNNNSLWYISRNHQSLARVSEQIALQQQVTNLEDDPMSANIGIKMSNVIARAQQYNRNIKTGINSLTLTDGYLANIKKAMDEVNDKVIAGAQDVKTASERAALAMELNEILKSVVNAGNAYDGTRYVFGGQHTTTPPFTIVNGRYVNYTGNDTKININVDTGTSMPINMTGSEVYGNMVTKIPSRDMNPDVNLSTDNSTRLADLNGGDGVPKGKIKVYYSAYPDGLEVDLSGCDTLEDVKDTIEKATLEASRNLNPAEHGWLNGESLDWRDLQDRYVKVTVNPAHNGISLQEFDLGEPLPEPTAIEKKRGLAYSGSNGYFAGGTGVANQDPTAKGEVTVHDKIDYVNHSAGGVYHARLRVDDVAQNKVAENLGIKGSANAYNPLVPDKIADGFIHGRDLDPVLSERTLLADLEGYNDSTYTFTNGAKPGSIVISEVTQDANNVFNDWNLSGLTQGKNTGPNGELYVRAVNRGTTANPEIHVEVYTCPVNKATAADLVATGLYTNTRTGGTVELKEANSSGVSGTVGVVLPDTVKEATVDLNIDFGATLQGSVHVPAFVEEQDASGKNKDPLDIFSGWNIRGLDKPPAQGYDENHPASTDLDGDVSVSYRYDAHANSFIVELSRPAFNDQPAKVIATGSLYLGDKDVPPLDSAVSGRIEFTGAPGFEGIKGSVYVELPAGSAFNDAYDAAGANGVPTTGPITLDRDFAPKGDLTLGGSMTLVKDLRVDSADLPTGGGGTIFKAGQVFAENVTLSDGVTVIPAGTPLTADDTLTLPAGTVRIEGVIKEGTVLAGGQTLNGAGPIAAGTVVPGGSYYSSPADLGFPVHNPALTVYAGSSATDKTANTYRLTEDAPAGDFVLGGATELVADTNAADPFVLTGDTVFKKGQKFLNDVILPGGGYIPAGTVLSEDTLVPKGATVHTDGPILEGTVLPAGQKLTNAGPLAAGTVIPRDSYYTAGAGFPASGMGVSATHIDPYTNQPVTVPAPPAPPAGGFDLRATFATIEDFNRAVEEAGIYVKAQVASDGKSLEFASSLAGAWLTVSEDTDCYEQMGDVDQQLSGLDLTGLVKGVNSDKNGNVYTEVVYYPPDPITGGKHKMTNKDGEVIELDPGYYVRVYSDPEQLNHNYEDRDNSSLVAEGFVPAGKWNPAWDENNPAANPPFVPDTANTGLHSLGFMKDLILEERNDSGVWGKVDLDYYGDRGQYEIVTVTNPDGSVSSSIDFDPHKNDDITVFPGGLRPEGSPHVTIQEWDMYSVTPGITCDYTGTFHGQITKRDGTAAGAQVELYRDGSHQLMTAKSDTNEAPVDGKITLYEVDKYGQFALDANGDRIVAGTVAVSRNDLPDGASESFKLTTGANRNYGQEREENAFSTINDIIDALNQNDAEALHNLIGNVAVDTKRVTEAAGTAGALSKRMTLLSERHADDITRFNAALTARVGMDDQALAAAVMNYKSATEAFTAAMQVSAQVMQMSLLQYL